MQGLKTQHLLLCHFLQINALTDGIFVWDLRETSSIVFRILQWWQNWLEHLTVVKILIFFCLQNMNRFHNVLEVCNSEHNKYQMKWILLCLSTPNFNIYIKSRPDFVHSTESNSCIFRLFITIKLTWKWSQKEFSFFCEGTWFWDVEWNRCSLFFCIENDLNFSSILWSILNGEFVDLSLVLWVF